MRLSEIFASIQGEGSLAGTPSVFIRTSFCNLRCAWCDTRYTSWEPEYVARDPWLVAREADEMARRNDIRHIVITGGEPMLQHDEVRELTETLSARGLHITIETNGTIAPSIPANLLSISPKLRNSAPTSTNRIPPELGTWHEKIRINISTLQELISRSSSQASHQAPDSESDFQFKFVVESAMDLPEIDDLVRALEVPLDKVYLMPQVTEANEIPSAYLAVRGLCDRTGYRFSPRLHIERFGNQRGT